jgi:hypothetical protein
LGAFRRKDQDRHDAGILPREPLRISKDLDEILARRLPDLLFEKFYAKLTAGENDAAFKQFEIAAAGRWRTTGPQSRAPWKSTILYGPSGHFGESVTKRMRFNSWTLNPARFLSPADTKTSRS